MPHGQPLQVGKACSGIQACSTNRACRRRQSSRPQELRFVLEVVQRRGQQVAPARLAIAFRLQLVDFHLQALEATTQVDRRRLPVWMRGTGMLTGSSAAMTTT